MACLYKIKLWISSQRCFTKLENNRKLLIILNWYYKNIGFNIFNKRVWFSTEFLV